jgi:ribosomal protein S18 acetylase RimI-like enzyme
VPGEWVIRKVRDDGFDGTPLEDVLARHGVNRMAVAGLLSEMCVSATIRGAIARGLQVVLVRDAHATYNLEDIPAAIVSRVAEHALGDEVELVETASMRFAPPDRDHSGAAPLITARDAEEADLPALVAIKGEGSEAQHRDRFREAQCGSFRYLVLLRGQEVIGFALLVSRRPASWSDANDTQHLPQMVDLQVAEAQRGQGYGSTFVRAIEREAARAGYHQLYVAVEPADNPRAYALYQRLGYQQLQPAPYLKAWEFTDSGGERHRGEDWIVDMVKPL